jgi:Ca2+/Na+ antiporter
VLGFFAVAWIALVAILALAPGVYAEALSQVPGAVFLAALTVFIAVLVLGVVRRWRWAFWLIFVAFLFGVLRIPASIAQLAGLLPSTGPAWYEALQGAIGLAQFVIALAMLAGYRRAGLWGDF